MAADDAATAQRGRANLAAAERQPAAPALPAVTCEKVAQTGADPRARGQGPESLYADYREDDQFDRVIEALRRLRRIDPDGHDRRRQPLAAGLAGVRPAELLRRDRLLDRAVLPLSRGHRAPAAAGTGRRAPSTPWARTSARSRSTTRSPRPTPPTSTARSALSSPHAGARPPCRGRSDARPAKRALAGGPGARPRPAADRPRSRRPRPRRGDRAGAREGAAAVACARWRRSILARQGDRRKSVLVIRDAFPALGGPFQAHLPERGPPALLPARLPGARSAPGRRRTACPPTWSSASSARRAPSTPTPRAGRAPAA